MVGELEDVPRTIEATRGAVVSAGGLTTISKVSLTESLPSLAVTFTETVPTSAAVGVPVNVRVAGSNVSHDGSMPPPLSAAVYVSMSPSASVNASAGTT